jgi:hypothetical protein
MKLIYIAGKYTGKTYLEIEDNIKKAEAVAIELIAKKGKQGYYPVTPHLNTAHFEIYEPCLDGIDYDYWLEGTAEMLKRCDGILLMKSWYESSGAIKECGLAQQLNIPIYFNIDDINCPKYKYKQKFKLKVKGI